MFPLSYSTAFETRAVLRDTQMDKTKPNVDFYFANEKSMSQILSGKGLNDE